MSEYEVGLEVAKNRRRRGGGGGEKRSRRRLRAKVRLPEASVGISSGITLGTHGNIEFSNFSLSLFFFFLSPLQIYPCYYYRKFVMAYGIIETHDSVIIKSMSRQRQKANYCD